MIAYLHGKGPPTLESIGEGACVDNLSAIATNES